MSTVSKNIFWSTLTSVLQLYTGSVVFIVLAKLMSVSDFGILSFGHSLSSIALVLADFGFSLMIIKDYPLLKKEDTDYLPSSLLAKLILSLSTGAICIGYLSLFYKDDWWVVGVFYTLYALVSAYTVYLQSLLKVLNRFKGFTNSTVVFAVAVTIVILFYWHYEVDLILLVLCLLLAKCVQLVWILFQTKSVFSLVRFNQTLVFKLIRKSWSYGMHTILGILYFMVDTQIISICLGAKEVALYQSVFRVVIILLIFSDVVTNTLLPYLSFKYHNKQDITQVSSKLFLYLLLIGCSLFLFLTSFKTDILNILYTPEYQEAAILVLPFSLVIILRTVSAVIGAILTVSNKQAYRVVAVFVSLLVSIVLNLILIPKFGILAGAWTSVVVHMVLFGMYARYGKMEVPKLEIFSLLNFFLLGLTAGLYMVINHLFSYDLWVIMGCVLVWTIGVYFVMTRNNNWSFLQQLLREKGVG